jgi:predicted HicB family RNase H-like nuclease
MMEYNGYIGKVEFDGEAGIIHGEVINKTSTRKNKLVVRKAAARKAKREGHKN